MTIYEEVVGENHSKTAKTYVDIGRLFHAQGQCEESLIPFDQAYKIYQNLLGENNENEAAMSHINAGYLLHTKSEYNKAFGELEKGFRMFNEALDKDHKTTNIARTDLLTINDDLWAANPEALKIFERIFGRNASSP